MAVKIFISLLYGAILTGTLGIDIAKAGSSSEQEENCIRAWDKYVQIDGVWRPVGLHNFCFQNELLSLEPGETAEVLIYKVDDETFEQGERLENRIYTVQSILDDINQEVERCGGVSGDSMWKVHLKSEDSNLILNHHVIAYGFPGSCDARDKILWQGLSLSFQFSQIQ